MRLGWLFSRPAASQLTSPAYEHGVAALADVDEGGLHRREHVLDAAEVDVARHRGVGLAGDVVLDEHAVLEDADLGPAVAVAHDHGALDALATGQELGLGDDGAAASRPRGPRGGAASWPRAGWSPSARSARRAPCAARAPWSRRRGLPRPRWRSRCGAACGCGVGWCPRPPRRPRRRSPPPRRSRRSRPRRRCPARTRWPPRPRRRPGPGGPCHPGCGGDGRGRSRLPLPRLRLLAAVPRPPRPPRPAPAARPRRGLPLLWWRHGAASARPARGP